VPIRNALIAVRGAGGAGIAFLLFLIIGNVRRQMGVPLFESVPAAGPAAGPTHNGTRDPSRSRV
jgi:hypothetical protein